MKNIEIAGHKIGSRQPCFIIAEAGVNHNGNVDTACRLVDAAVEAGVDAVKFQSFTAAALVSPVADQAAYQKAATSSDGSQLSMLRKLELSRDDHVRLWKHCADRGIVFLSTPFDEEWADFLSELGVPAFKIGSGELTNLPFLAHVAAKNKPVILSTGMSVISEVASAVETVVCAGSGGLILLQCTSAYPAEPGTINLRAMRTLGRQFRVYTGLSDHSRGTEIAVAACALGARVIEKHFTLDRTMSGPDHGMSLEPQELAGMVRAIRNVEQAIGTGRKSVTKAEEDVARAARRSLVTTRRIDAGETIVRESVAVRRPGTGLPPSMLNSIIGMRAVVDMPEGTLLAVDNLERGDRR